MKLLEKILVPLDFQSDFQKQITTAENIAKSFNSQIIVLHVLPPEAERKSIKSLLSDYVDSQLEKIVKELDKNEIKYRTEKVYGNAFDRIMSFAQDNNVNLILITDGTENQDTDFGVSVIAEKLIRKSEKPVWVIKKNSNVIPEKILCPVDFSDASVRALNNAIKITRTFNSELHIINVFEPLQESFSVRLNVNYQEENSRLQKENEKQFDDFIKTFNPSGIKYKTGYLKGNPHEAIVGFARANKIDLIFMGATGKSVLQRVLLGSVTEKVVRDLPCSIVTTKSENLLNLKIESDISTLEKHYSQALKLKETGFYDEAIEQLKICLYVNDLHIPAINELIKIYELTGDMISAKSYRQKLDEILERLWDSKIQLEIRKAYKLK
ncbi:MAG: universal stress protein [Bacteroidales bacterium]|nr:universal stress protein [Bacteroidales bacterium]